MLRWIRSRVRRFERYDGFSITRRFWGVEVDVTDIDVARQIFLKTTQARYRPLVALLRSCLGHRILIVADGEDWRQTRDAISPHLTPGQVTKTYAPVIAGIALQAMSDLAQRPRSGTDGSAAIAFDVEPFMRGIATSVMGYVMFGQTLMAAEAEFLEQTLSKCMQTIGGLRGTINAWVAGWAHALNLAPHPPFLRSGQHRAHVAQLLDAIEARIDQSLATGVPAPMIVRLMERFADHPPARQRRLIAAEYVMLLIAGVETTGSTLTFALMEIARDPLIRDRLAAEARGKDLLAAGGEALSTRFPYAYGVVQEVMRRHTVVPTMLREADADVQLATGKPGEAKAGVTIRRGGVLRYLPVSGHMRRSVWKTPKTFDPGRFIRPLSSEEKKHYNPFGLGPQSCAGRALAMTEMLLVLTAFFQKFDLTEDLAGANIARERNLLFTIRPVGLRVAVQSI